MEIKVANVLDKNGFIEISSDVISDVVANYTEVYSCKRLASNSKDCYSNHELTKQGYFILDDILSSCSLTIRIDFLKNCLIEWN